MAGRQAGAKWREKRLWKAFERAAIVLSALRSHDGKYKRVHKKEAFDRAIS